MGTARDHLTWYVNIDPTLPSTLKTWMLQIVVPFLMSLYDYWVNSKMKPAEEDRFFGKPIFRLYYILLAVLLMASGFLASSLSDGWQSTYICLGPRIYLTQAVSVILDIAILLAFTSLAHIGISQDNG